MNFSPKAPAEEEFFAFNYTRLLGAGDVIVSAEWTIVVKEGVDPSASSMISGAPLIEGAKVSQKIVGGVAGVRYCVECAAATDVGERLVLGADLWVREACA